MQTSLMSRKESLNTARKLGFGAAAIVLLDAAITFAGLHGAANVMAQQKSGFASLVMQLLFPYFGKFTPVIWKVGLALFFFAIAVVAHFLFMSKSEEVTRTR